MLPTKNIQVIHLMSRYIVISCNCHITNNKIEYKKERKIYQFLTSDVNRCEILMVLVMA